MRDYNVLENMSGFVDMILAEADGNYFIFKDNNAFAERESICEYNTLAEVHAFIAGMFCTDMRG